MSLIGPNGAGKTTFFNMLTGAYKPTAGEILFAGRDVGGLPPHRITKLGIGRTFQNIRLFQTMTLARERAGRHALPPQGRPHPQHPAHAPASGARSATRWCGRASCSLLSASPSASTTSTR